MPLSPREYGSEYQRENAPWASRLAWTEAVSYLNGFYNEKIPDLASIIQRAMDYKKIRVPIYNSNDRGLTEKLAQELNKTYGASHIRFKADIGDFPAPESVWLEVVEPVLVTRDEITEYRGFCIGFVNGRRVWASCA